MEAGKRIITDIFNRARTLQIPFFQRAYVWEEENWERFLDDMLRTARERRPYFLGSVIQKQQTTSSDTDVGDVRAVVDGQQRLTTLVLLFKSIFDARNENTTFDVTFRTFANTLILKHNHSDIQVFEAILEDRLTSELREQHPTSRVLQAHDYFERRQSELAEINPHNLFQLVYFVGIDLGREEDEQQIFDTINSLGVALSTAELLKNELFGREDLELYNDTWRQVFEADESSRDYWGRKITAGRNRREAIDLFLQAFLAMQPEIGDDVRVDSLFDDYKRHLRAKISDRNAFIRELTDCAKLFRQHISVAQLDQELDPTSATSRMNILVFGLNTTTVLPYVLYLLRHVPTSAERDQMLRLLETHLIRRLVCRETSKGYNKTFTSFVRGHLNTYASLVDRLTTTTDSTLRMPTDQEFAEGFQTSKLTNQQARVVLYLLERSTRDDARQSTALSGLSHYSLEHLIPKKWRNHWGRLPDEQAIERDQALRKLGNLSLLSSSLNTSIRDADWKTKKNGRGRSHGLLWYAQGLETLAPDLELGHWDETTIASRGVRLAEQALETWPRPKGT